MNARKLVIRLTLSAIWLAVFVAVMRYIGAQWEMEGRVTTGLLLGVSVDSPRHILYSIATLAASAFVATSLVLFLALLFRRRRHAGQKLWLAVSVAGLALTVVAFAWNRRQLHRASLPTAYRYYDSTGRLLDPERHLSNLRPVNVILISIDTLNPLHLGVYGYARDTSPTIDSLAQVSVLFQNAFSHSPKTSPAHMSLFTSLYPSVHKIRNWNKLQGGYSLDHHLITLPEILKNAGYTTVAFTGGGNVQSSIGFGHGFDQYDNEDQVWEKAFQWLDQNHDSRFFLFLHTFKVHSPYLPPPPYNAMFDPDYDGPILDSEEELWQYFRSQYGNGADFPGSHALFWERVDKNDPREVEHVKALYDGGIRFMNDRMMAVLLEKLRRYDLVQNTVVIFLSDHGEEFQQHGDFLHKELYDEHIRIPLIWYFPDQPEYRGKVVPQQASLVDVTPTLLQYLGLPIPVMMQGTNLLPIIEGKDLNLPVFSERIVISDVPDKKKAIRTPEWKYIWWPTQKKAELFDLRNDPGELVNVAERFPEVRNELHKQVLAWMRENASKGESIKAITNTLDPETIEKLKSLGYIR